MNLTKILAATVTAASLLPAAAFAGTESGFYLGAGVGQANVGDLDVDGGNVNFSGDDTGWKIFGGYNFGWIPLVDLAIEGGYVNFGNPSDNGVKIEPDGFDIFGLVGVNLGPVGLFGKVGAINWNADVSAEGGSASDDGTDPAYGIGARMKFGSIEVRAEGEYFDIGSANDVYLLSLSGAWTF